MSLTYTHGKSLCSPPLNRKQREFWCKKKNKYEKTTETEIINVPQALL